MEVISRRSSGAAPTVHSPWAPAALLQACTRLVNATDRADVADAASALLDGLVPGASVDVQRRPRGSDTAPANGNLWDGVRIPPPVREQVEVSVPGLQDVGALVHAASELVEARIEGLRRHADLTESVEQLARSERLQRALYAIADQASSAGNDLKSMFEALHAIVGTLMYAGNFYIVRYDAHSDCIWFPYFADSVDSEPAFATPGKVMPEVADSLVWPMADIAHGPTWYLIHDGKPLMGSQEVMERQVSGAFELSGALCKDFLGVPLLDGDKVVGCVVVQSYDEAHHYNEQDKALLAYVAQHIQTALERRLAHVDLERRVQDRTVAWSQANDILQREVVERQRGEHLQAALFQIAELASSTGSIDTFYAALHRVVGDLLYARNFYIALLSADGSELTFPYLVDEVESDHRPRKLGKGMTEYVMRKGSAALVDAERMALLQESGDIERHGPASVCWLGVPLVCGDTTVGALAVQSYSPEHSYTARDQELLTFVSYHIANALERMHAAQSLRDANTHLENRVVERTRELALANRDLRSQITERERVEARLKYQTLHDSLTGLPNRTLLMRRMGQALEHFRNDPSRGCAVLFMDLDRFKVINDSVGHLVGDGLLVEAANRIRACLKVTDTVARLGGDEFSVLLAGVNELSHACQIAARIIESLDAPFRLASKELFTSVSVGVALATERYQSADELLRDADSAMYRAKADGRHRLAVFDEDLRKEAVSLMEVENDLRRGLTRDEFVPYYQPVVDLESGAVLGYEALMRWHHPRRGVLLPGAFLNVAEDTGISETIDWQIFTQVCRDANALAGDDDRFVAINLSPRHFRNPHFGDNLLRLLAHNKVAPARLHVEVTEGMLLKKTPTVERILQAFRKAGISISLDDFGTGYSSLSYLHQYPLQTLKIDRSFVANLTAGSEGAEGNSDAVIRAILAMAKALSIQVIAEGVETPEQRDLLYNLGCRRVQGFLYAKAEPVNTWTRAAVLTPTP